MSKERIKVIDNEGGGTVGSDKRVWSVSHMTGLTDNYVLLGEGDRTMLGDIWYNFTYSKWECVPLEFCNIPVTNYLVARMKTLILDVEKADWHTDRLAFGPLKETVGGG